MSETTTANRVTAFHPWLLVLIGLLVYANSLDNPFVFDDHSSIINNSDIRQLWPPNWALPTSAPHAATNSRPVTAATLAFNYALGGLEPGGYRAFNIGVHLLCALALYGVLARSITDSTRTLAFSCALFWLVHPLNSQCINYTIQRSESLVSLFYLLVLYCIARADQADHARWSGVAVAAAILGMASKEVMVTAPLLALIYDRIFVADSLRQIWQQRRSLHLGLFASWSMLALLQPGDAHGNSIGLDSNVSPWIYALNQCWVIIDYLQKILWPKTLIVDYGFPRDLTIADIWPQALFLTLSLTATIISIRHTPRFGFLPLAFFVVIAPTSSIIPLANEVGAERRVYLAMIGPIAILATAAHSLCQRFAIPRGYYTLAALVLACGLGYRTIDRNRDYANSVAIWQTTAEMAPHNPRAHNNLGFALDEEQQSETAIVHYRQALAIDPEYPDAHYNLGNAYMSLKNWHEAINHDRKMLAKESGNALKAQGEFEAAAQHYYAAKILDPDNPASYINFGALLLTLEKYVQAADYFEQALDADPPHAGTHNNLGFALRALNRFKEAKDHFRQACGQTSPRPTTISAYPCALSDKRSKPQNNSA